MFFQHRRAAGEYPEAAQLSAGNGAATSVPLSRRSLIGSHGGTFTTEITSSVGRSVGQISTYQVDVPGNRSYLQVNFHTADASPDNTYTFSLVDPSGAVAATATSPASVNGKNVGQASLYVNRPVAGRWTIEVQLNLVPYFGPVCSVRSDGPQVQPLPYPSRGWIGCLRTVMEWAR